MRDRDGCHALEGTERVRDRVHGGWLFMCQLKDGMRMERTLLIQKWKREKDFCTADKPSQRMAS